MEKPASSDPELLADWLGQHREAAFHALVARYAGLVHATAKRTCRDDSMAGEVSQLTFITLARKAKSLTSCASLGGWLHATALMQAKNLIRKSQRENRKRQLLQTAMEIDPSHAPEDIWKEMQPILDDALASLSDKDREALLLRFYRSLTVREIATTLGIATDAAQKRIDRATDRLRGKLARRGCQVGGSLAATMLAGFSGDAQAAVIPVSVIASKALTAGSASAFSLSACLASLPAAMKFTSLIPAAATLILAGAWTGTKYYSLSAAETRVANLRESVATARIAKTPTSIRPATDNGLIDWVKLANEEGNGPEFQRFKERLLSMSRDEMISSLQRIAALEIRKSRLNALESLVVKSLGPLDPVWVLNRFTDRLRDLHDPLTFDLHDSFGLWATRDLAGAAKWVDERVAAGDLESKRLNDATGAQPRDPLESSLINALLASDPAAATRRLIAIPEKERIEVMIYLANQVLYTPLKNGNHRAYAKLVRTEMPQDLQTWMLVPKSTEIPTKDDFLNFRAYLDAIQSPHAERNSCMEHYSGDMIRKLSGRRVVTLLDLEIMRAQFAEISPGEVDTMTAKSLSMATKWQYPTMRFSQAAELAASYTDTPDNNAVLATFLEISEFETSDKPLGRELTRRVNDKSRRERILKRFN